MGMRMNKGDNFDFLLRLRFTQIHVFLQFNLAFRHVHLLYLNETWQVTVHNASGGFVKRNNS